MGKDYTGFYINGKWVQPDGRPTLDVINPQILAEIVDMAEAYIREIAG